MKAKTGRGLAGGKARGHFLHVVSAAGYLADPNLCEYCGKAIPLNGRKPCLVRQMRFCDKSCAAKANNRLHPKRIKQPKPPKKKRTGSSREVMLQRGLIDPILAHDRRMRQLDHEEAEANKLRTQGFEVYSPTVVCDRVAIRNGKVFFVEFKRPGQKLRPGQQAIQNLVPEMYVIQFSN